MSHKPYLTVDDLPSLKLHIERAKREGQDEFQFPTAGGAVAPLYVPYAEYCVQFLEMNSQKEQPK